MQPNLLDLARQHDQSAWNELVRRYTPLVWRVATAHRLDPADAADVCQHTWITLADALPTIRDAARLPGWLVTTARREALRILKSRTREVPLPDTVSKSDLCPETHALLSARDRLLWRAFAALSERCQRILGILAHTPDVSYAQVAHALGIKIGSVGQSRTRCLHELRRKLAILGLTEGAAG
jgi:RNA polymerase sigma factor (sigma-70 family)